METALRPLKKGRGAAEGQGKAEPLTWRPMCSLAQNLAREGYRERSCYLPAPAGQCLPWLDHSIRTTTLGGRGHYPSSQKTKPNLGFVQQAAYACKAGRRSWELHPCVLGPSRAFPITSCCPLLFSPTDVRVWGLQDGLIQVLPPVWLITSEAGKPYLSSFQPVCFNIINFGSNKHNCG